MAKNTIGQFIAALRKANGMTQQEVADRLNVSNKAVSRWERDECAPDLSAIPALAEMFGVTCDELLKGERIPASVPPEQKSQKVEKQVRHLVNRTLSGFKTMICIALAVAAVGLVLMFGISYGFYRPVIGFAVMLLFEICALAIVILGVSRAKDVKTYNELFEMAEASLTKKFDEVLGTMSFMALFAVLAALLLSLPLVMVSAAAGNFNAVLPMGSYFTGCLGYIVLILAFVYLRYKRAYIGWIVTGERSFRQPKEMIEQTMTRRQLALCGAAGLLLVFGPYLDTRGESFSLYNAAVILALACFAANIVLFLICLIRNKACRKTLVIPGIRNAAMILPTLLLHRVHEVSWTYVGLRYVGSVEEPIYKPYETWHTEAIWYALGIALGLYLISGIVDMLLRRNAQRGVSNG